MSTGDAAPKPLAIIVARAHNGVIGYEGSLPWHIPEDLKHFKRVTTGHAIIMGRLTYESIGKPLPNRQNIVVTRDETASFPGCEVAHSLAQAIELGRREDDCPFVIGGASLFAEAFPLATTLYITEIDRNVTGDTLFPDVSLDEFDEVEHRAGETEDVTFRVLKRKAP